MVGTLSAAATADADDLLQHHMEEVRLTYETLTRSKKLPSVVDPTRVKWTIALALAALHVPGEFIETGVYHGGTSITMMRVLDRAGSPKLHFACDSFQGLPKSSEQDNVRTMVGTLCTNSTAAKPVASVNPPVRAICSRPKFGHPGRWRSSRETFEQQLHAFNVTLPRLRIVAGWFKDTLPPPGLKSIAFLRVDGDLYNSTRDALERLEPLVSPGGYVYIDDYGSFRGCALAVDEYRSARGYTETVHPIVSRSRGVRRHGVKFEAVWWRKASAHSQ